MACGDFSLWYNRVARGDEVFRAMACGDFSLWYNS